MAVKVASRLEDFFKTNTHDGLRSIVRYAPDEFEIEYLRADVETQYEGDELREAIDHSRMESLSSPVYRNAFSEEHGDLECLVQSFENVVEMNFVISDGEGVAVALDTESIANSRGLVVEAREILVEER